MVALREVFSLIEALRRALDPGVYLWLNAYKSGGLGYYTEDEVERLQRVDALFAR